ncbi:MAG: LamG domain-containing protein [Pelagibacterales bacterium]|nr:LamG domain-containing protein [Pelagibacterales bacterium]
MDVSYNRTSDNAAILTGVIDGKNLDSDHVAYKFYTDGTFNGSIVDIERRDNIGLAVGASFSNWEYYQGYIGELIVFSRALNDEERKSVEKYLSQKWGIPLTS